MCTWERVPVAAAAVVLLVGCASSSERADRAVVFSGSAVPACEFEVLGDVTTVVMARGRTDAENRLHNLLGRAAVRRGGDGVLDVVIKAPERLPFVVSGGRRPTEADLPAAEWSGTGQAIRFTDPSCRR